MYFFFRSAEWAPLTKHPQEYEWHKDLWLSPTGRETESWPPSLESSPLPPWASMAHHTSEVRMFSSSRLNINGFSLGCWGSDLCLIRELGNTPVALLSPSRGVNKESSGVSSVGSSFSLAWGTGVQGCQEEATDGALQRTFFSSTGSRPLRKTELGPPERLELPARVKEMDLENDISLGWHLRAWTAAPISLIQLCMSSGLSACM